MQCVHIALIPKSVQCGTFCNIINQVQRIQYAATHESYLDAVLNWNENPPVNVQYYN